MIPRKNCPHGQKTCLAMEEHLYTLLCERDILYQTRRSCHSSGRKVGQINNTFRALHIPTGIIVQVVDSGSPLLNRQTANKKLMEKMQQRQFDASASTSENAKKRSEKYNAEEL
jgi:protein subunit release factor A